MTITDIYYASAPSHTGVWLVFKVDGEEGFRPLDLDTAVALRAKLNRAIEKTRAQLWAGERERTKT